MWFKRIFKLVKVSFHFHHGLQIPDVPFSPKLLASLFCHNWIESTVSYLRTLLTNTLIFLLLGRWHWHLYQFTQTLFHSLYVSSLASELEILSQKQAFLSHHKWRLQQSLCRYAYLQFSFISLLLQVATPGPYQSIEMYNLNLWPSDSLIQTFFLIMCASLTFNHAPNLFGLTFLNSSFVFLSTWEHLHLIVP